MKKTNLYLILLLLTLTLGCTKKDSVKETIIVSIVPEKTFAEKIVKDKFNVIALIPPGSSPASYKPTPRELTALENAKLYFTIGVSAETSNILPYVTTYNSLNIVDLSEIENSKYKSRYFDTKKLSRDPHSWLSVIRVIEMIETMTAELIAVYPEEKDFFTKNSNEYIKELTILDNYIKEKRSELDNNFFLIYHPSFGYFAEDYNLEMIPIEAGGKEASIKQIDSIIQLAKEKNIHTIFYQEEMSKKQVNIIANEIDATVIQLKPLGKDYIENQKILIDSLAGE